MSEEYKANVDLGDVTSPAAGPITARGFFVDGQHFWLNQQEDGPTLDDIDEMCERRNFSYYYDDWGPSNQDSRTVLQSMMNEAIARWGRRASQPVLRGGDTPSDDEIVQWANQCADATRAGTADHFWAFDVTTYHLVDLVRAALAHFANPPC